MSLTLKLLVGTAYVWGIPFMIGLYWRSERGLSLTIVAMVLFLAWVVTWLAYLGWWVGHHLCY